MLKNIFRLPSAFAPMFISVFLTVVLVLICSSVSNSCEESKKSADQKYDVTLTLTLKERNEYILKENGEYVFANTNTSLINANILNVIKSNAKIKSVDYITNEFFFQVGIMCPQSVFEQINNAVLTGGTFSGVLKSYSLDNNTRYDIGAVLLVVYGVGDDGACGIGGYLPFQSDYDVSPSAYLDLGSGDGVDFDGGSDCVSDLRGRSHPRRHDRPGGTKQNAAGFVFGSCLRGRIFPADFGHSDLRK